MGGHLSLGILVGEVAARLICGIYRFMAASKVLGEETIAGSAAQQQQQQQQRGSGNSDT